MNKDRRMKLYEGKRVLYNSLNIIKDILREEENAFDNLTESLQQTRRGERMEENVDILQEIVDKLEEILEYIDDIS